MKAFKFRTDFSKGGEWQEIPNRPSWFGMARIQAVFYSNTALKEALHLRDADQDEFMPPLFGQPEEDRQGVYIFDTPVTVRLPISYLDEDFDGNNRICIWGETFDDSETAT
jgi:hypothetical protein